MEKHPVQLPPGYWSAEAAAYASTASARVQHNSCTVRGGFTEMPRSAEQTCPNVCTYTAREEDEHDNDADDAQETLRWWCTDRILECTTTTRREKSSTNDDEADDGDLMRTFIERAELLYKNVKKTPLVGRRARVSMTTTDYLVVNCHSVHWKC